MVVGMLMFVSAKGTAAFAFQQSAGPALCNVSWSDQQEHRVRFAALAAQ